MKAGEDEPLLRSKGMGSKRLRFKDSLAESTFVSGRVVSGLTGTPVLSDGVAVESPQRRLIRVMTRCICGFFGLALLAGIVYMIWQRREPLKHWINAFFLYKLYFHRMDGLVRLFPKLRHREERGYPDDS